MKQWYVWNENEEDERLRIKIKPNIRMMNVQKSKSRHNQNMKNNMLRNERYNNHDPMMGFKRKKDRIITNIWRDSKERR